ncbi:hypothetical protein BAUCODRAFT_29449 [Baudoinia panamericana UAMH 10762]|uniref:Uncharacterized protein n=1 Tax=Baudoinia panamericana (strain UAMH 10762) TaxID=717646 RepID=M2NNI8_BAUPA|nr:uncharacterized protein BAUCODRAFT_29449 [Baudoinia panamericana UAMH 10762]EMD01065.1 hypothetical protein BAUCODRAFT_29449 [Baudoinia panamericana UAMH 10762]
MPPPRLIDPAVFYDVVKIRKAVDEAAQDSVRASTGISNAAMTGRMDYFGAGGGPASQLSKERIFKIRQKAVKLLAKAYTLDEVAASVATMQATSTVEDVGLHVLKREPGNVDAKYVHFFHEKIPSRAMEQYTPLDPLNEVISSLPLEQQAPPLRTRALVQIFKSQWEGAATDLTMALRIVEEIKRTHKPDQQQLELASKMREEAEAWNRGFRDWRSVPQVKEEDQPKSLEQQLYFNRGGVYLTMGCKSVHAALDGLGEYLAKEAEGAEITAAEIKAHAVRLEARKRVKTNAKRAMKDYAAFLAHFDYTPGLPYEITNEIMRRVYDLANGNKTQTPTPMVAKNRLIELDSEDKEINGDSDHRNTNGHCHSLSAIVKHEKPKPDPFELGEDGWPRFPSPKIHPASALFAEKPPSDLPPFPSDKVNDNMHEAFGSREAVTYHPLLTDALHSLLLAHALLQTSPTELLRHAHNAARLARIADGYPIFQAARSPARADWIEVLRRANNWLGLEVPWQKLCAPAPLPDAAGGWAKESSSSSALAKRAARREEETPEQKRERIKQESILEALSDDRVVDEESFQRAVRARERRAMDDEVGLSGPLKDKQDALPEPAAAPTVNGGEKPQQQLPKRWAQEENGREYPISTDRAEAISRWIREAPLSMGGGKKKRPARKKKPTAGTGANGMANGAHAATERVGSMAVGDDEDVPD